MINKQKNEALEIFCFKILKKRNIENTKQKNQIKPVKNMTSHEIVRTGTFLCKGLQ